jgi:hypothetical protein
MSSIFPGSASVGQIFEGYSFNGIAWDLIGNEFNPTTFSPNAPDNPKAGDLWVDSDSNVPSMSNETILTIDSASATYATKAELENISSSSIQPAYLPFVSGGYYRSPASPGTAATQVINKTFYSYFYVGATTSFDRIGCRATTVTTPGTVRLGIYADNSGVPETLVLDAGTVGFSSNSTVYEITIDQSLDPGWYWLAFNCQSGASTFASVSGNSTNYSGNTRTLPTNNFYAVNYYEESSVTGSFPETATPSAPGGTFSAPTAYLRAT